MKKSQKSKEKQQNEIENKKKNEEKGEIKNGKNEKIDKINNNDEKNKEKVNEKNKKVSPWIFLYGNDLQGFHTAFILMIIFPISVFFIIRFVLNKFNFTKNQQDVFGVVGVLISVWIILVSYIIYYFRNDFYTVFCKKKEKEKDKTD